MLHEIEFEHMNTRNRELYFSTSNELARVLAQSNPVYLVLELPGAHTRVIVCFPKPGMTRVYHNEIKAENLVGEHDHSYNADSLPPLRTMNYRYGMRLPPWMFNGWIKPREMMLELGRNVDAHYKVLNRDWGHGGIMVSVFRREKREEERLEIRSFDTGNDFHFLDKWLNDKDIHLLARFIPVNPENPRLFWKPDKEAAEHNVR
ncbi:hypothetical protein KW796_01240 [Candidatus Parcubacteria bacterium]|nr:hypothetical protein [Candidatus Parcubacteria bacterium]